MDADRTREETRGEKPFVSILVRSHNDESLIGRTLEGSFSAESSKLTFTAQSMKKANYRWWRDYN